MNWSTGEICTVQPENLTDDEGPLPTSVVPAWMFTPAPKTIAAVPAAFKTLDASHSITPAVVLMVKVLAVGDVAFIKKVEEAAL